MAFLNEHNPKFNCIFIEDFFLFLFASFVLSRAYDNQSIHVELTATATTTTLNINQKSFNGSCLEANEMIHHDMAMIVIAHTNKAYK